MSQTLDCTAYGFVISFVVAYLKKVPLIDKHPKITATVIAAGVAALHTILGSAADGDFWPTVFKIAACVVQTVGASVLTHEAVINPVANKIAQKSEA